MGRHNNFDALRLVAAIAVILSHAFLLGEGNEDHEPLRLLTGEAPLGIAAVFVFFTISGFLVTQSFETTGSPLGFVAKRALRIFPGLILCLLLSAFVIGPALTALPLGDYFAGAGIYRYVVSNIVMIMPSNALPGIWFSAYSFGDVFNGPLWTLPCEVLMYLLVLALGATRQLKLPVLVALIAIGMIAIWFDCASSEYVIGGALWLLGFFAAGMALYKLRATRIFDARLALLALLGLIVSVKLHLFILFFPLFGAYLVLFLALDRRLPVIPAARFGDLSYGLYIYGWPVEQTIVRLHGGAAPWWLVFAIALPVTAAIAFASWHLVEQPALRLKTRRRLPAFAG